MVDTGDDCRGDERSGQERSVASQAKKVRTAPSVGCASQLPYDDDEFVEGPIPFLARMQRDPLCDAPDTDLIAEEREKFPTVRVRVPPWLTIEPHFIFCKNFVVIFEL
nr:hypothetical protein Itr_chr11CG19630 [Ipomoea trifida]